MLYLEFGAGEQVGVVATCLPEHAGHACPAGHLAVGFVDKEVPGALSRRSATLAWPGKVVIEILSCACRDIATTGGPCACRCTLCRVRCRRIQRRRPGVAPMGGGGWGRHCQSSWCDFAMRCRCGNGWCGASVTPLTSWRHSSEPREGPAVPRCPLRAPLNLGAP